MDWPGIDLNEWAEDIGAFVCEYRWWIVAITVWAVFIWRWVR